LFPAGFFFKKTANSGARIRAKTGNQKNRAIIPEAEGPETAGEQTGAEARKRTYFSGWTRTAVMLSSESFLRAAAISSSHERSRFIPFRRTISRIHPART